MDIQNLNYASSERALVYIERDLRFYSGSLQYFLENSGKFFFAINDWGMDDGS